MEIWKSSVLTKWQVRTLVCMMTHYQNFFRAIYSYLLKFNFVNFSSFFLIKQEENAEDEDGEEKLSKTQEKKMKKMTKKEKEQ